MDTQDEARQDVERIMRRAEALGYDPARVARALEHDPLPPVQLQPVMELRRQSWLGAQMTRRFARRS